MGSCDSIGIICRQQFLKACVTQRSCRLLNTIAPLRGKRRGIAALNTERHIEPAGELRHEFGVVIRI
jgi:hypothetical protein